MLAPPRVLGGVLAGAASWLEEEIKERKVVAGDRFSLRRYARSSGDALTFLPIPLIVSRGRKVTGRV